MPVSSGGSSSSAPEFETTKKICSDLLLDKVNNLESKKLGLAEEKAMFYERSLGLKDAYVKPLEWSDAEKAKEIEVLEKKYEDVVDLKEIFEKEYEKAQLKQFENQEAHLTCLDHYLDLFHLCNGTLRNGVEPINHTKLLLFDVKNGQLTTPKSKAQEHKQEEQEENTSEQERKLQHKQHQHP
jgi:hypothetical protein